MKSDIIFYFSDCLKVLFLFIANCFLSFYSLSRILDVRRICPKSFRSRNFNEFRLLFFSSCTLAFSSLVMLCLGLAAGDKTEERPDTMEQSRSYEVSSMHTLYSSVGSLASGNFGMLIVSIFISLCGLSISSSRSVSR
jgi:formate hydrogenlyase subunit 3/multisubunit Na+/H+ antiporter MnhD subunit